MVGYDDKWSNLPDDLLNLIVQTSSAALCDYFRLTLVCKSWRHSLSRYKKPCLPLTGYPFLLLAEEVAPGAIDSDGDYDSNEDYGDTTDEHGEEDSSDEEDHSVQDADDKEQQDSGDKDQEQESDYEKYLRERDKIFDHNKISVGSSRGLYSLLTGKTYDIDLPEAAGRVIVGTNIGWLLTLGTDLQINLLHPLLRHQIPLPSMLTFPKQLNYDENYLPADASEFFIQKVSISSKILNQNTATSLYHHCTTPLPVIMALYMGNCCLGFARLGDKVWTDVNIPSCSFHDIVYHNGKFYVVDCHGGIFVCDDDKGGDIKGTKIGKLETNDWDQKYLVESSSGSSLLLLVRDCKIKYFAQAPCRRTKYHTTSFSVWRLDLKSSDSIENISCDLIEENYLGNEAIFIGRNSSVSIPSSDFIKPNSIYFTDDNWEIYLRNGGGHDMGIFDIKSHTIEPHYPGKSIHPISPPLWYI